MIAPGPVVASAQTIVPDAQASSDGSGSSRIRAAAAQMVFAARKSKDFITPQKVAEIEAWTGRAVLEALVAFEIPDEVSGPCVRISEDISCCDSSRLCTRRAAASGRSRRTMRSNVKEETVHVRLKGRNTRRTDVHYIPLYSRGKLSHADMWRIQCKNPNSETMLEQE